MATELACSPYTLPFYEGLVHATAQRFEHYVDLELEDLKQVLRIKVWRSLEAFDSTRSSMTVERYVFQNITNAMKDALKIKRRGDAKRKGGDLHIEDFTSMYGDGLERSDSTQFAARYLSISEDEVFSDLLAEDDLNLPSSLSFEEAQIAHLLVEGYSTAAIAGSLMIRLARVRALIGSIQIKMLADSPDLARHIQAAELAEAA